MTSGSSDQNAQGSGPEMGTLPCPVTSQVNDNKTGAAAPSGQKLTLSVMRAIKGKILVIVKLCMSVSRLVVAALAMMTS